MSSFAFVLLFALPQFSHSACHGSKTSYRGEFMGELTQDNQVLVGHVIATFSVKSFTECFGHCDEDCRCRSFNLPMTGKGNCELNSADNSTVLMRPKPGWRYHHLQVKEVVAGDDTCYEPYSNGCCDNNPCANGATCMETGDRGKPGFNCTCANEYNTGPLCKREINSCFDYLWNDKTAESGYYNIWEKNTLIKSTVYCDMQPDEWEAWTLVMSYAKANVSDFETSPFYVDSPRDETNADSGDYRLSLAKMRSIQTGMTGNRLVEWKATCGYSFNDGRSTNDDVVRSTFQTLDLFNFVTPEKGLVGYYPFDNVTEGKDMSGYGNHASMYNITYEEGPLGNPGKSARMSGSVFSYIRLYDNSQMLDTRYSLTIMMQAYTHATGSGQLLGWQYPNVESYYFGPYLWAFSQKLYFRANDRDGYEIRSIYSNYQITQNQWHYVAATYDYENSKISIYRNGVRKHSAGFSPAKELGTQSNRTLTIGAVLNGDTRVYNGRVACLKIYNTAFTDDKVKAFTESWECPHEPAPICHRVNYIKIRGHECYNCNVWATQTNTEIFSINAYRGDQKCNFNSGSTIPDENIFGVYQAVDSANHACASSQDATTQYWFGGRL